MQLSPFQSRLAASMFASCLLVLLYLTLFAPRFAVAAELGRSHLAPLDDLASSLFQDGDSRDLRDPTYEPEFSAFDRSILGRAPVGVTPLVANDPKPMNVVNGTTQVFVFEKQAIFGRDLSSRDELQDDENVGLPAALSESDEDGNPLEKRNETKTVFISVNTCQQPFAVNASNATAAPPQLTLYVSTSSDNKYPGPGADADAQLSMEFTEGAVMYNLSASEDVYFGVSAPNVSSDYTGPYNVQAAVSTDGYYYSYDPNADADLIWVDSDSQGALLITHNLTNSTNEATIDGIMKTEPYVMFAQNLNDTSIDGLRYSYCGLQKFAQIAATRNGQDASMVMTSMTRRGAGNLPKQQFYFGGLNSSSNYEGILAQVGRSNGTGAYSGDAAGGGRVFRATQFSTKSDHGNCEIIFDLPFCDQVAYSVPGNPANFANSTLLAAFYDDYASYMFSNFKKVLQQIACETSPDQLYSLVRNCTDCETSYKAWLCSVTIPRCEDISSDADYLQPRNVDKPFPNGKFLDAATIAAYPNTSAYTSSRNPLIDSVVQPGPYKEVLPCDDLCYSLVQNCHPSIGFSCPKPGYPGYNTSYGRRTSADLDGAVTCNYPGSAHMFSGSARAAIPGASWFMVAAAVVALLP